MKWFWIIMVALVAATAYLMARGRGADQHAINLLSEQLPGPEASAPSETRPVEAASPAPKDIRIGRGTHTPSATEESKALTKDLEASYEERAVDDRQAVDDVMEGDDDGETEPAAEHRGFNIDRRKDGSMFLDDRYVVRGSGTEKDPYRITWELLVSASESYAPDQDMYEMPPRIEFLNGKHVRITGFLFTAMLRDETTELLVMRNMWDGCCVGVPPSSYDAIEVTLRKPIQIKGMGLLESGVLSGVLKVDPYVKDNWLLGLYVMQDGVIDFGDL